MIFYLEAHFFLSLHRFFLFPFLLSLLLLMSPSFSGFCSQNHLFTFIARAKHLSTNAYALVCVCVCVNTKLYFVWLVFISHFCSSFSNCSFFVLYITLMCSVCYSIFHRGNISLFLSHSFTLCLFCICVILYMHALHTIIYHTIAIHKTSINIGYIHTR